MNLAVSFVVFQSTHLHEVWLNFYILRAYFWSFNPHTYMRCDSPALTLHCWSCSFNPHTYMRCDTFRSYWASSVFMFQSTHLHEVWHGQQAADAEYKRFNPHTYMRCDQSTICTNQHWTVSIHTPTWGVTLFTSYLLLSTMFQSTHLHEVWQTSTSNRARSRQVSIHTPTWGVTRRIPPVLSIGQFQSTHLHEVWQL